MSKRARLGWLLEQSRAGTLLRRLGAWRGLLVLNYHRIGEASRSPFDRGVFSASPAELDQQLRLLKCHFDVIDPRELTDAFRRPRRRSVLITFDDGYRDNYELAFPILQSHGIAAAFFVCTGFLDQPGPSWWDEIAWMARGSRKRHLPPGRWLTQPVLLDDPGRETAIRSLLAVYKLLPGDQTDAFLDFLGEAAGTGRLCREKAAGTWMTWDMVRELHSAGMTIGGHSVSHPILARLPAAEQQREVAECLRRLTTELGTEIDLFAYPVGSAESFDDTTRACLHSQGVRYAFSFRGGFWRGGHVDSFDVPRVAVSEPDGVLLFRALLALPQLFGRW